MRTLPHASTCSRADARAFTSLRRRASACRVVSKRVNCLHSASARTRHLTHAADGVLSSDGGDSGNNPRRPTDFGGSDGGGSSPPSTMLLSVLCALCSLAIASPANARVEPAKVKQAPESSSPVDAYVEQLWAVVGPTVSRLGFSGLMGMAAASALKWIGRTLIVLMGLAFLLVQSMSSSGMIEVRWPEVNKRVLSWLHFDPNGVNGDDVKRLIKSGMAMISEGVPDVAGFLVGFTLGLRML